MIAVFDDFIKDEELLLELSNDIESGEFFKTTGAYKYWKGWWDSPQKNIKQKLTEYIWGYNLPIQLDIEIDGFEYWTGLQTSADDGRRNYLELHLDDDVNYRTQKGKRLSPVLGCVYYPPGFEFTGGDLAIYTNGEGNSPELIKTIGNRLVIFNPGEVVHGVQEVTSGTRGAIAINLWSSEPWSVGEGYIVKE